MLALQPIAAYLLGSVPFGYLICLGKGIDVREQGSGNIGATNVARAIGKRWGVVVMLLDLGKGLGPTALAGWLVSVEAARSTGSDGTIWLGATMVAAVVGHVYSAFLGLRGGKGVATTFGVVLGVSPPAALAGFVVYALLYLLTRVSSVGSLASTLTATVIVWVGDPPLAVGVACSLIMLLITWRHRENIGRLMRGEEQAL